MAINGSEPLKTELESINTYPLRGGDVDTSEEKARVSVTLIPQRQIDRNSADGIVTAAGTAQYDSMKRMR